jgi:hypothetical protein
MEPIQVLQSEVKRLEQALKELRLLYAERVVESQMHRLRADKAEKDVRQLKGALYDLESRDPSLRGRQ